MSEMPSESTLEHVRRLLAFETVTRRSNLALIEWAEACFRQWGARVVLDYSDDRTKANLFATFGEGPGGWVLSGHSDVVPVDGQPWSCPPFEATVRDSRLYGRGACDMKGFIGAVMGQARHWSGMDLQAPVHVALTYDEESGCLGVPGLLKCLHDAGIRPDGCIVGEPTDMQVVTAHKGGRVYRCRVRGCAAHSSLTPQGVNAIEYAARLISFIQDLSWREAQQGLRDDGFGVPFTTISTNTIVGGNGRNIIPAECEFYFDYRYVPGMKPGQLFDEIEAYARQNLEPRMRQADPRAGVEFECTGGIPALSATEQDRITQLARSLLRPHRPGRVSYGTEAGFFQEAGIPSVVCGPGSIEQAHKADEYVELSQLAQCERFVSALVDRLRTPVPA